MARVHRLRLAAMAAVSLLLASAPVMAATGGPTVVGQVAMPGTPIAVAVSPSGDQVYVIAGPNLVATRADNLQEAWSTPLPRVAEDVAVHPSGSTIYAGGGRSLSVIDADSGVIKRTFTVMAGVHALAVTPDGRQLWVMSRGPKANLTVEDTAAGTNAGAITVLDTRTSKVIDTIGLGPIPQDILMSPSGARVYVLGWGSDSIWIINAKSRTVMSKIKVRPWPEAMALNPAGSRLLVSHSPPGVQSSYAVTTINTEKRAITGVFRHPEDLAALAINQSDLVVGEGWLRPGEALIGLSESLSSLDYRPGLVMINMKTQQTAATVPVNPPCDGLTGQVSMAVSRDTTRAYVITECIAGSGVLTAMDLGGQPDEPASS